MNDIQRAAEHIAAADAILIGASNGLSIAEWIHLFAMNQAFDDVFGDFKKAYGVRSIFQGMTFYWPSEEVKWAFWSRLIHRYCQEYRKSSVMDDLLAIVRDTPYFIVTSNGEGHFEQAGFDKDKIFEVEGTWQTMQCASPCHDVVYPALEWMERMAAADRDGVIPTELIPRCPRCGGPMTVHFAVDPHFIPDKDGQRRLTAFLQRYHDRKLAILELGIGWRNQLIKKPLMELAAREPQAFYVTINLGEVYIADAIAHTSIGIDGSLSDVLAQMRKVMER